MTNNRVHHRLTVMSKTLLIVSACLMLLMISACQQNQIEPAGPTLSANIISNTPAPDLPEPTTSSTPFQNVDQPGQAPDTKTVVSNFETEVQPEDKPTPIIYPEDFWKELPIIPESISETAREVYKKGLEMGNDPRSFIRVGDCNSRNPDFLAGFDGRYNLGEYTYLQPVIDYFKGSFGRYNQTANPGMTTSRVLVSLWNNGDCLVNEPMLECQFRLDNPSIEFIALGTIDAKYNYRDPSAFERNLRIIIENSMQRGIVPILVTKADNLEGDNSINATIARLAMEYELPLWNFWKAAQSLTNHGLNPDLEHLNYLASPPSTDFSVSYSIYYGKEVRNLNGLQMLNFMMEQLPVPEITPIPTVSP